jgi:hypothetical protein
MYVHGCISVCMYVHGCISVCMYVHGCISVCMYVRLCRWMHAIIMHGMHAGVHDVCTCGCAWMYVWACMLCVLVDVHGCMDV